MRSIRINPLDNVAVMLDDSSPEVPRGHKFALRDIAAGENIIKYGLPIGHATCAIRRNAAARPGSATIFSSCRPWDV